MDYFDCKCIDHFYDYSITNMLNGTYKYFGAAFMRPGISFYWFVSFESA